MGTDIYEGSGLSVERFYGGDHRGLCVQFTTSANGCAQLTAIEARELLGELHAFVADCERRHAEGGRISSCECGASRVKDSTHADWCPAS